MSVLSFENAISIGLRLLSSFQQVLRSGGFVGGQIVEDDDIAALQCQQDLSNMTRSIAPLINGEGGNKCLGVSAMHQNALLIPIKDRCVALNGIQ